MTQVIINKHNNWNDSIFGFISNAQGKQKSDIEIKDLLFKYADVWNINFHFEDQLLSIEEVGNCLEIYRGTEHILTIKFQL